LSRRISELPGPRGRAARPWARGACSGRAACRRAPRAAARQRLRCRRRRQEGLVQGVRPTAFLKPFVSPGQADSTHPENPAARGTFNADGTLSSTLLEDAAATCRRFAYRRLAIVRAPPPEPDAADAWVTFQARGAPGARAATAGRRAPAPRLGLAVVRPACVSGAEAGSGGGRWCARRGRVPLERGLLRHWHRSLVRSARRADCLFGVPGTHAVRCPSPTRARAAGLVPAHQPDRAAGQEARAGAAPGRAQPLPPRRGHGALAVPQRRGVARRRAEGGLAHAGVGLRRRGRVPRSTASRGRLRACQGGARHGAPEGLQRACFGPAASAEDMKP